MFRYVIAFGVMFLVYSFFDPLNLHSKQSHKNTALQAQTCWFSQPNDLDIHCYNFMPTNIAGDASGFKLPLAIFKAKHPPKDQATEALVIKLSRLGESDYINSQYMQWWVEYLAQFPRQDVILVGQRGVGRSQPRLQCFDQDRYAFRLFNQPFDAARLLQQHRQYQQACWQTMQQQGVDLSTLSLQQDADDLSQLMTQLNYPRWHLLAEYYGADIALQVAAQGPAHLASVIISAPQSAQYMDYAPVIAKLDHLCQQDTQCSQYVSVAQVMQTLSSLDQAPYQFDLPNNYQRYLVDEPIVTVADFQLLQFSLWMMAQYNSYSRTLPAMLYDLVLDKANLLGNLLADVVNDRLFFEYSQPVIWAHYCNDGFYDFNELDNWPKILTSSECAWPHPTTSARTASSSAPVLYLESGLDIISDPTRLAMRLPSTAQRVYNPNQGYGLRALDACSLSAVYEFMQDGTVTTHCDGPIELDGIDRGF